MWFADDAAAGDSLLQLKYWWSELLSFGRYFGYHVNAAKTWLVVMPEHLAPAQHVFDGMGIQITSAGRPYLGAPLDFQDFIMEYTLTQISQCITVVTCSRCYTTSCCQCSSHAWFFL